MLCYTWKWICSDFNHSWLHFGRPAAIDDSTDTISWARPGTFAAGSFISIHSGSGLFRDFCQHYCSPLPVPGTITINFRTGCHNTINDCGAYYFTMLSLPVLVFLTCPDQPSGNITTAGPLTLTLSASADLWDDSLMVKAFVFHVPSCSNGLHACRAEFSLN